MPIELKAKRPEVTVEGEKKKKEKSSIQSLSQRPEIETKLLSHGAFRTTEMFWPSFCFNSLISIIYPLITYSLNEL